MRNLLGRLLARNRGFLVACALVLGWFQFLFCALVAEVDLENALDQLLAFTPPAMRAVVEQSLLSGTTHGVLAFGWDHPITHALVAAVAIALAARAVAGEVEGGVIELLLAQPLPRGSYLAAHVLFGIGAILCVAAAGVLGTAIGVRVFDLQVFGAGRLLGLLLNAVLLQGTFYAVTLLFSAWGREAGRVAMLGVLLVLISYFIDVFATLWPRLAFLAPYSLHTYYDPRAILVRGEFSRLALLVLGLGFLLPTALAYGRFRRRDLP